MTWQDRCSTLDRSKHLGWLWWAILLMFPHTGEASPPVAGLLATGLVGQAQTGTIKGRLVWGDENIPPAKVLVEKGKSDKDPDICAKDKPIVSRELVVDPKTKGVAHGFAYLVRPKGDSTDASRDLVAKQPKVALDQKSCEFQPYALPLHKDQTLVIKSSDPKSHNVRFAGFNNPGINQTVAPLGQLEVKLVPDRLPLELHCDIHPWMKGYLMVFDHPFFTTTGTDGAFEIKGVPAGDQSLIVWQEKVGYVTPGRSQGMPVTVRAGGVTDVGVIKLDLAKGK
ncbi:MAG: carboxypeptidase regulatory-like domain-containing protein [Isosphaerales bacterium]